jgi:hypothetical protein
MLGPTRMDRFKVAGFVLMLVAIAGLAMELKRENDLPKPAPLSERMGLGAVFDAGLAGLKAGESALEQIAADVRAKQQAPAPAVIPQRKVP